MFVAQNVFGEKMVRQTVVRGLFISACSDGAMCREVRSEQDQANAISTFCDDELTGLADQGMGLDFCHCGMFPWFENG